MSKETNPSKPDAQSELEITRAEKAAKIDHTVTKEQRTGTPERATEPTVAAIKDRVAQLVEDNLQFATYGTLMEYGSREIQMLGQDGSRITVERVIPGRAKEGYTLQDFVIDVVPGDGATQQQEVEYNYNEYGDGLIRKSVFSADGFTVDELPEDPPIEDLIANTYKLINATYENIANIQLEEDMGLINLPADQQDLVDIAKLLDTAAVLDPRSASGR